MFVALQVFDGLFGGAGATLRCAAPDPFLMFPFAGACENSIPESGSLPVARRISEDPQGMLLSLWGGGTSATAPPAWSEYALPAGTEIADGGPFLDPTYELAKFGDTVIGRTATGLAVQPPDLPAPDPVMATLELPDAGAVRSVAQNGFVVALGSTSGIRLVDVGDVRHPQLGSILSVGEPSWLRFVDGDPHLYARIGDEVSAWNVGDPHNPVAAGSRTVSGSADVAPLDGTTALFVSATGSLTLEAWNSPTQAPALLRSWELSEPHAFFQVAGDVVGGEDSFVRTSWPEPLTPRALWGPGFTEFSLGGGRAESYSGQTAVTYQFQSITSIDLDHTPAEAADYGYAKRLSYGLVGSGFSNGQLWVTQEEGLIVATAEGALAGSIHAMLPKPEFGQDVFYDRIAIHERVVAYAAPHDLVLYAPLCTDAALGVPNAVTSFEVVADATGCAVIEFETAQGLKLELFGVRPGDRWPISVSKGSEDRWRARDCPDQPLAYELADQQGSVYARIEFEPGVPRRGAGAIAAARPNPFNPRTLIEYAVTDAGPVSLRVYDGRGRRIRTLVDETMAAGNSIAIWNGLDDAGTPVSAGVYFVRLRTGNIEDVMKVALVK